MQVRDIPRGEVKLPNTDAVVSAHGSPIGAVWKMASHTASPAETTRRLDHGCGKSLLRPRDPANRVWDLMFGKGIVDPVDNLGTQHPPCSPELLEALASQLIEQNFNLRELFRTVALAGLSTLHTPLLRPMHNDWRGLHKCP